MTEHQLARGVKRKRFTDGADDLHDEPCFPTVRKMQHEPSSYTAMDLADDDCHAGLRSAQPICTNAQTVVKAKIQEACFGSFLKGPPATCGSPSSRFYGGKNDKKEIYFLEVLLGSENCVICSPWIDELVGFINLRDSHALRKLFEFRGTRLEISLTGSEWKAMMQPDSLKASNKNVEIAIFGLLEDAFLVGDCLSSYDLFLQDPRLAHDTLYSNPHKFPFTDISDGDSDSDISEVDDSGSLSICQLGPASGKLSKSSLQYVLDNLHEHEYLHPVESDEHLAISLFPHQKEAIDFMIRRETVSSHLLEDLLPILLIVVFSSYRHAITGDSIPEPLAGPFGGILADTMGLGKTVTTLSTIVSRLNHAKEWAEKQINKGSEKRRAKATLIVLPNEVLMDQWLDEIRNKFVPGTFATCRYHGASRKIKISTFEEYDIVLTTYGTMKVDFSERKSLIFRTEFYRIVLDEGMSIDTDAHDRPCL
ncbi:unnamed protein product [Penicillium glandicola]